ncbi:Sin3 histone deacetylase corepressor complex component SDS3 [Schistosoma japonicum]|nr:Sin3 histone deacetylase corepressor complex component SDS3 [Schistosoma japonicum]
MKRKHTEKSGYVSASVISAVAQDLSDDFEDTYNSEMACIQTQLDQLDNKTHPEFVKIREEIENWYAEQKQRIQILHEHKLDTIYREYTKEAEACDRDCEHEKRRIQAYLVSLCEELKRRLEHDKKSIELTPSGGQACSKISNTSNSTNGTVTGSRKHASHATNNNNISNNNNSNTSQLSYHSPVSPLGKCYEENISSSRMIKDSNSTIVAPLISSSNSIGSPNSFTGSEDLSVIRTNTRSTTGSVGAGVNSSTNQSNTSFSIWIDDGRLYCGHKCYQIGASVILEGRDGSSHRCAGTIVSIGVQDIAIRRSSDHGICRVTVQQLKQGRYALWPNKNE